MNKNIDVTFQLRGVDMAQVIQMVDELMDDYNPQRLHIKGLKIMEIQE